MGRVGPAGRIAPFSDSKCREAILGMERSRMNHDRMRAMIDARGNGGAVQSACPFASAASTRARTLRWGGLPQALCNAFATEAPSGCKMAGKRAPVVTLAVEELFVDDRHVEAHPGAGEKAVVVGRRECARQ